jgi:hypothetical protein
MPTIHVTQDSSSLFGSDSEDWDEEDEPVLLIVTLGSAVVLTFGFGFLWNRFMRPGLLGQADERLLAPTQVL